jgi:YceI-like domain
MRILFFFFWCFPLYTWSQNTTAGKYVCQDGEVHFRSEAPLETIEARSKKLRGIIDPVQKTFAWIIDINTFSGFNSALQREHFKENYMETNKFPTAWFKGKIIESVDLSQPQKLSVRAKGVLNIHGLDQERIIKIDLDIKDKYVVVTASFTIPLAEHNINIPKIVNQKISEDVHVQISAKLIKE